MNKRRGVRVTKRKVRSRCGTGNRETYKEEAENRFDLTTNNPTISKPQFVQFYDLYGLGSLSLWILSI